MRLLADAAPTGAGLAIITVILLAFVAICLLIAFFVIRGLVRLVRRRKGDVAETTAGGTPQAQ